MKEKLTVKQQKFIEGYLIHGNATKAYYEAGYKAKSDNIAGVEAHKLLKNPKIKNTIDENMKQRSENCGITAEFVLNGIKDIALKGKKDTDKLKAYELLGKHLKLFTDKVEANIETDVTIVIDGEEYD
jgi:phage terminase small subunit